MNRKEDIINCNLLMPNKKKFTFAILKYSSQLTIKEVNDVILKGFEVWSKESGLCIVDACLPEKADIKIRFGRGASHIFDGKWDERSGCGTTVAHMHSPNNGEIYFDDHEHWTANIFSPDV